MKKVFAATVLFVCFAAMANTASAQEKLDEFMTETSPEERAQMQTDYMKESLTLTEDQVPQVHAVNLKYARRMQDAYNSGGGRLQKLKKMKAVNQEKDSEVKRVLTSTQYATYEKRGKRR
jgi:predicted transglutaminase-like cysteine proteinase